MAGVRVIDLSQGLSGPLCTVQLAALGAEVIKVERVDTGDGARHSPPFAGARGITDDEQPGDISTRALKRNRDKKSLALDLSKPEGVEILLKLAAKSDVVLENFRPGVSRSLGIDYEALKKVRPDIIYCAISGFGSTGPYRDWSAMDAVVQAMSGLMAMTGAPAGSQRGGGLSIASMLPALFGSTAILAALRRRDLTGQGDMIEIAMFDCLVSLLWDEPVEYFGARSVPPGGNRFVRFAPWNTYRAADGEVVICAASQAHFVALCGVMERGDLLGDKRFDKPANRVANVDALDAEVTRWTLQHDKATVIDRCQSADIVCGPVNRLEDLASEPGIVARGLVKPLQHPVHGAIAGAGAVDYPVRFENIDASYQQAAPLLGQHTSVVLEELLGLSRDEVGLLAARRIVRLG
ncbi:CaiB/BaiF CoA-transferase family protein [soil metagenome]